MAGFINVLMDGTVLNNRYQIIRTIAAGGFGITYKVTDLKRGMILAVKEFYPRDTCVRDVDRIRVIPTSDENYDRFEYGKDRFMNEVNALLQLRHIPEVVKIYDCFEENNTCYYAMEFVDGNTLKTICQHYKDRRVPSNVLIPIIIRVADAMQKIHDAGMFHRDIAPDNFMLTSNSVKIIDFGNTKELIGKDGEGLSVYIKPGFAPIEQYSSKGRQGTYSDVYALAATTYYLLSGGKLEDAYSRTLNDEYTPLTQFGVDKEISDTVDRALVLRAENRTQTMREFASELRNAQHKGGKGDDPEPVVKEEKTHLKPVIEISNQGQYAKYVIPVGKMVLIGSSPQRSNIVVRNRYVSRLHCEIFYQAETNTFIVEDKSTNGTYVNRKRLVKNIPIKIPPGNILGLGLDRCLLKLGVMK